MLDFSNDFRVQKILESFQWATPVVPDWHKLVTLEMLTQIGVLWGIFCASTYEAAMFRAVGLVLFFLAFRPREVLCQSSLDTSDRVLTMEDVAFEVGAVVLTLRFSKTDQRGQGKRLSC